VSTVGYEDYSEITEMGAAEAEKAILQGALQGSAAAGDKRSSASEAGSQMSRRRLAALTSSRRGSNRNISQTIYRQFNDIADTVAGACELDSHADTCVAGANSVVLEATHQTVNVSAFSDVHQTMDNIPIVTAAMAYDDPTTGITYILIMGQALYMGDKMKNTLLCPNQLRSNGIIVDECPKHLAPVENPSSHSIYSVQDELRIPLILKGVTSGFHSRTPTKDEIDNCKWIYLSNEHYWDPHSHEHQEQEEAFASLSEYPTHNRELCTMTVSSRGDIFNTEMGQVAVELDDKYIIAANSTSGRIHDEAVDLLVKSWNIGKDIAKKTVKCTTQKGVRTMLHPIERRFRTKQAQLRYRQLSGRHGTFYTDTFFASVLTLNGCTMARLYINDLSFCKVYPMKAKSDVADTLSRLSYMTWESLTRYTQMQLRKSCMVNINSYARIMEYPIVLPNRTARGRIGRKAGSGS